MHKKSISAHLMHKKSTLSIHSMKRSTTTPSGQPPMEISLKTELLGIP